MGVLEPAASDESDELLVTPPLVRGIAGLLNSGSLGAEAGFPELDLSSGDGLPFACPGLFKRRLSFFNVPVEVRLVSEVSFGGLTTAGFGAAFSVEELVFEGLVEDKDGRPFSPSPGCEGLRIWVCPEGFPILSPCFCPGNRF